MQKSRLPIVLLAALLRPVVAAAQVAPWTSAGSEQTPGESPVSRQEVEDLRRQILQESRSSVELLFDLHRETGDLNSELDFLRYGARVNIRLNPATTLFLAGYRTPYQTKDGVLESSATGVTLGARRRASERADWEVELSGARFTDGDWSVTGLASFTLHPSDALRYSVTLRRTNVEESLLSVAGLRPSRGPFAGLRVGGVHDNRAVLNVAYRLPARFDVFAEAGVGSRSGSQVDRNFFKRAGGGLGFNAVARAADDRLSLLRLSLAVDYSGFDENRFGYGGASLLDRQGRPVPLDRLGSDGISPVPTETNPGLGGYFSPHRFLSRVVRIDVRGRSGTSVDYSASAFAGTQSFTGVSTRRAGGVSAGLTFRFSERLTLPVVYAWDDFGPFVQQSLVARLVMLF